jgi:uncharacterized protein HemY
MIGRLLVRAEEASRSEMRSAAIRSAVAEADALIAGSRPDEALTALERAKAEHGESSDLDQALDGAREAVTADRRESSLAEAAEIVREHLASYDFSGALAAIDAVQDVWPGEERLVNLRTQVSSAEAAWAAEQEIAAFVRECERLCAEEKYEEARDAAEGALRTYPEASKLMGALLAAWEGLKQQHRAAEVAKCIADAA